MQSHLIYKRIRMLADEKKKKVIAFVEDVAASGGYMIACARDEIVVDPSSIVGSIGVISASFGFDKAIKKLGVERRVHTAGDHKMSLDPFQPEKAEDVRPPQGAAKGHPCDVHRPSVKKSRGQAAQRPRKNLVLRRILGRRKKRSNTASPTGSGKSKRCCASATARRSRRL